MASPVSVGLASRLQTTIVPLSPFRVVDAGPVSCGVPQNSAAGEVRDSRRSPQRTSRLQGHVHSARGEAGSRGWRGAGPSAAAQAAGAANEAAAQWRAAAAAAGGSSWHAHYHVPLPAVRTS